MKNRQSKRGYPRRIPPVSPISGSHVPRNEDWGFVHKPKDDLQSHLLAWQSEDFFENIPMEVYFALHKIEICKEDRKRGDIRETLSKVNDRVTVVSIKLC